MVHIIRGQQVMIDSDLARLYDFMFVLTQSEFDHLRCKKCTSNDRPQRGGTRYLPYAFTEQGVAMLSGLLKSDIAIEVNIRIMRAFVAMRSFLMSNAHMFKRLETIEHHQLLMQKHLSEHDRKIEEVLTRPDDKCRYASIKRDKKKLIVITTTNLLLTLKSNTMKNSMQN